MPGNFANAQDLVAIEEIRDNTLVLKDGSLRQILIVSGVNFSLKSTDEQNIITLAYQNFLNSVDFPLQIFIHSRKLNINKYLSDLEARAEQEPSPLLQNQTREYKEFISSFVQENAIMEKNFFMVVPWHPISLPSQAGILSSLPFFKKNKAGEEKATKEKQVSFEENLSQIGRRVTQVMEGMGSMGLDATVLNNEQLIELFYNLYNPEDVEKEKIAIPQ